MRVVAPATLITLAGPDASTDVAARSDRSLRDLVATVSTELGVASGPFIAWCYRVAAPVRRLNPDESLMAAGVLDGDLLYVVPAPPPPIGSVRNSRTAADLTWALPSGDGRHE